MNKSHIVAVGFAVLITLWMISGMFKEETTESKPKKAAEVFAVEVETMRAQETPVYLTIQGQTVANREVTVKALTESVVKEIVINDGDLVEQNQDLLTLDMQDRQARLEQEKALLSSREKTLARLQKLAKQQYQSENDLELAQANVKASRAAIERIELDIAFTRAKAPMTGLIQELHVEEGDYVKVGDALVSIIENNPLVIEAQVAQQHIQDINIGTSAEITLATGQTVTATVRFIAPQANPASRTFLVELALDNIENKYRSGISATVKMLTQTQQAHYVSAALFSLNSKGTIGIKTVSRDNIVVFNEVEIVHSDENGSWVIGLPASANVIITGQGFVQAGSEVKPVQTKRNKD